jgi:hypothetical protein
MVSEGKKRSLDTKLLNPILESEHGHGGTKKSFHPDHIKKINTSLSACTYSEGNRRFVVEIEMPGDYAEWADSLFLEVQHKNLRTLQKIWEQRLCLKNTML